MCERWRRRRDLLRVALRDDAPTACAAFGAQVDDPVGLGDHVEVVLDHDDRVAGIDEPVQHAHQLLDVGHVQTDRRFIEHVERALGARAVRRPVRRDAAAVARALRRRASSVTSLMRCASPPDSVGTLLAQRQVAEADVLQQTQRVMDARMRREELGRPRRRSSPARRRCCGHDAATASVSGSKRRPPQTSQSTLTSGRKLISMVLHALAFAGVAAPAGGIEREAARAVAAHARLGRVGEELADVVPEADVGRRARARRLADRRLVDLEHAPDRLPAANGLAADPVGQRRGGACRAGPGARAGSRRARRARASTCPSRRRR